MKAGRGAPVSLSNGFYCLSITHRVLTLENTSCLLTKQKQHCESITKHEKSLLFILILFTMLYVGVCCISLVIRHDTWIGRCYALVLCNEVVYAVFHMTLTQSKSLWCWCVKMVTCYVKCWFLWAMRNSFDVSLFSLSSSWWSTSGCPTWTYIFTKH